MYMFITLLVSEEVDIVRLICKLKIHFYKGVAFEHTQIHLTKISDSKYTLQE